jgi:hypothetical protein
MNIELKELKGTITRDESFLKVHSIKAYFLRADLLK